MRETTKALTGAALLFGVALDPEQIKAYLTVLGDYGASDERTAAGVRAACQVCKFMPKPVEIIDNMPEHRPVRNLIGPGDDWMLPPEDRAFGVQAVPLLVQYATRKISRDEYLARLRWEAKKAGVEHKIDWTEFGPDAPWNVRVPA